MEIVIGVALLIAAALAIKNNSGWSGAGLLLLGIWLLWPGSLALLPSILDALLAAFMSLGGHLLLAALAMMLMAFWGLRKMIRG